MKCKQCDFETSMVSDFRHHMYLKHNAKKPNFHRCESCNEKFYNFEDLLSHRSEGKCESADNHVENSKEFNGITEIRENLSLPQLKLERLSAATLAQYSKFIESENGQKVRCCVICRLRISHKNLLTHIRAIHVNCNTFKCSLCDKAFNDKSSLNNHILQNHTTVRPFLCNLCGTGFSARKYLTPHILGCLKNNWSKCQTASGNGNKQGSIEDYVKEMTGEVPCPMCKAVCTDYTSLINHMKRHRLIHPGDTGKVTLKRETDKKLHECEVCSMKFSDLGKLVSHKRVHQKSTGVAAKRFRKKLKQSNQVKRVPNTISSIGKFPTNEMKINANVAAMKLQKHELGTLNGNGVDDSANEPGNVNGSFPTGSKVFSCDYIGCQYASNNDANMKRHKRSVHKEGDLGCNREIIIHYCHICAYETNQQGNLVRHLANQHDIGEIQNCAICPFESYSKEKLKNHMKKVHKVKPTTTCKNCQTEFKTHYEMKVHHWKHLRENTSCTGLPLTKSKSKSKSSAVKSKHSGVMSNTSAVKLEPSDLKSKPLARKSKPSAVKSKPLLTTIKSEKPDEKPNIKQFHICKDCGKSFIRKTYLQKHIDCVHTKSDDEEGLLETPEELTSHVEKTELFSYPLSLETAELSGLTGHLETPASDGNFLLEPEQYAALNFISPYESHQTRVIGMDAI